MRYVHMKDYEKAMVLDGMVMKRGIPKRTAGILQKGFLSTRPEIIERRWISWKKQPTPFQQLAFPITTPRAMTSSHPELMCVFDFECRYDASHGNRELLLCSSKRTAMPYHHYQLSQLFPKKSYQAQKVAQISLHSRKSTSPRLFHSQSSIISSMPGLKRQKKKKKNLIWRRALI